MKEFNVNEYLSVNKNTHFLRIFEDIINNSSIKIKIADITAEFLTEMLDCLKENSFFYYILKNPELIDRIFISYLEMIVKEPKIRNKFLNTLNQRLEKGKVSIELGNLFELFFAKEVGRLLMNNLVTIDSRFNEIIYKIIRDFEFSYGYWDYNFVYRSLTSMSRYIGHKLMNIVENNDFEEFLRFNYCRIMEVLSFEDFNKIILNKFSKLLDFILNNVHLLKNNIYVDDKYDIFNPDAAGEITLPHLYKYKTSISKSLIKIIKRMNEKQIKVIVKLRLDHYITQDDIKNLNQNAKFLYLRTLYRVNAKLDEGYERLPKIIERITNKHAENKNAVSLFVKEEILRAIEHHNPELILRFYYLSLYGFLHTEDAEELIEKSDLIEFMVENMEYYDDPDFFINYIEPILSKIITNDSKIILSQKIINIVKREKINEIKSVIKLGFIDYIEEKEIDKLFTESKTLFLLIFEEDYNQKDDLYKKIEDLKKKYEPLTTQARKDMIITTLKENDIKKVFKRLWDKWWFNSLTIEDFIELVDNPELELLESLLKSVHYEAFEKKYDHTCAEFPLLPERFLREARESLKVHVFRIIKKKEMDTFVPLLGNALLDLLNTNEILRLVQDPNYFFIESLKNALENHDHELYYFRESFDVWLIQFLRTLNDFNIELEFEDVEFSPTLPTLLFGIEPYKDRWKVSESEFIYAEQGLVELVEVAGKKIFVKNDILDLSNSFIQDLKEVKGLFQSKQIKELNLSGNKLINIPEQIGSLQTLERLYMSHCELINLPNTIGDLINLQELNLGANNLTILPNSIGKLKSLKELNLSYNELSVVPESFRELKSIEIISFHSNPLIELPYWFGELTTLKRLDFVFTQLKSLPDSIGLLSSLKFLNLTWTRINSLPNSIGNLKSLEYLDIPSRINSIPDTILNCTNLKKIEYINSKLDESPVIKKLRIRGVKTGYR